MTAVIDVARRIRRAARRLVSVDGSISHVEVVVLPAADAGRTRAVSEATLNSIGRARDRLVEDADPTEQPETSGPGAPVGVSVGVSVGRSCLCDLSSDGRVLWLFMLDGAELEPLALRSFVDIFSRTPNLDMAYTDAAARLPDEMEPSGPSEETVNGPWLLPGFSPDRLADQYYLGHVVAFRPRRLVSEGPGTQQGRISPAQIEGPWSLAPLAATVAHLPQPLYRPAPDEAAWGSDGSCSGVSPTLPSDLPMVSVVIPTNGTCRDLDRGPTRLVDNAVRSVVASDYPRIEIVIVRTPGSPTDLIPRLMSIFDAHTGGERILTVVGDSRPFNFSNACNRGAVWAQGEILVFLNDDTEVRSDDWLTSLVHHARRPEVGAVGGRLLYEDGRVQHAGIWSRGGHPTHRYEGWPGDAEGHRGALAITQNCLAVTGAALAVERSKFDLVGGFSPVFPNSYNDVDLCLKLWDRGLRTVIEPRAELYHFEASSRDPSISDDDLAALHDRWRWRLNHDPFDNPNHTAERSEELPLPPCSSDDAGGPGHEARLWPLRPVGRLAN